MADKELFSVAEFMHRFEIGRTSFYKLVAQKEIPIIKRGRRTLIARTDAEAWLETLRRSSANGGGHD